MKILTNASSMEFLNREYEKAVKILRENFSDPENICCMLWHRAPFFEEERFPVITLKMIDQAYRKKGFYTKFYFTTYGEVAYLSVSREPFEK